MEEEEDNVEEEEKMWRRRKKRGENVAKDFEKGVFGLGRVDWAACGVTPQGRKEKRTGERRKRKRLKKWLKPARECEQGGDVGR